MELTPHGFNLMLPDRLRFILVKRLFNQNQLMFLR